jgi:delta-1-pyrroline-5-carboxylate synthetase
VITEAIPDTVGSKLIGLVTTRAEIPELLKVNTTVQITLKIGTFT